MLFNLLSNAFKVTPENGRISVSLERIETVLPLVSDQPVKSVCIAVTDTGPGLPKDHLERIFERFYQVEELNSWYFGGTGIGLEVVKSFIQLHKGKIAVESEVGSGTTFSLFFPLGKQHFADADIVAGDFPGKKEFLRTNATMQPNEHLQQSENENLPSKPRKATVLIIDDNAELRNYIKTELHFDYHVELAKNGFDGLAIAEQNDIDIIITDVMMPEMDGFEFCGKIRANIKTSHIPLIMLSAKSSTKDQITGIDKGADVYLTKPFEITLLKSQIRTLLNSRRIVFNKYFEGISHVEDASSNTTTTDRAFMSKMLTYIHENISNPQLSVENLADELSLSRSQLYRKIKALTGLKSNAFIRKIRLEKAREMLTQDGASINEVSHLAGFSSPSY
ncbi:MAG: response regulator, partial [Bacteroidota bacterium]